MSSVLVYLLRAVQMIIFPAMQWEALLTRWRMCVCARALSSHSQSLLFHTLANRCQGCVKDRTDSACAHVRMWLCGCVLAGDVCGKITYMEEMMGLTYLVLMHEHAFPYGLCAQCVYCITFYAHKLHSDQTIYAIVIIILGLLMYYYNLVVQPSLHFRI